MKSTKKSTLLAVVFVMSFVMYNLLLFLIAGFEDHYEVFWMSYAFMMVAFAMMLGCGLVLGARGFTMRDWLFRYPIIKHTVAYLVAQLVASTLFMIFEDSASWKLALVVMMIILFVYMVFAISCLLTKQTIDEVEDRIADKTAYIKLLRADASLLESKTADPALKALCRKFAEDVRYSDPMSCEALFELEKEISLCVADCSEALAAQDADAARTIIERASLLLRERNAKCKALK